jgi:hypothetical protein
VIKNRSGQVAGAQLVGSSDGSAFTGTVTVYITIDGGTQAIGTVGSGLCTHEGNGYHSYTPSAAETNGDLVAFTFIGTGAVPATIQYATVTAAQASALQTASGTGAITVLDLVTSALRTIRVVNAADPADPNDAAVGLDLLNELFDAWNADGQAIYADQLLSNALTPSLSPHTLGPNTATWTATQRPEAIKSAILTVNDVAYPIAVHQGLDWWQAQTLKTQESAIPTDLSYDKAWPNANLYFWPIPTAANVVDLLVSVVLGAVTLTDTFWMPPAYRRAIRLSLSEELADAMGVDVPNSLPRRARDARATVFVNNIVVPKLRNDAPFGGGGGWDYMTGRIR